MQTNPYQQNQYGYPSTPEKKKWSRGDWFVKVWIPIIVPVVVALIGAGYFVTKPATPTSAPIRPLASSYIGAMTRDNDGSTFGLSLSQVSEDQSGNFTASAVVNQCPAAVSGTVTSSGKISFTLRESTGCQDQGLVGSFSGNVQSDGSMSGSWTANTFQGQLIGTWSLQ